MMSPSGHNTMVPRPAPDYETAVMSKCGGGSPAPAPTAGYEEDVTLNWADEVDREFPLENTFEDISSDEMEVTSQGGLEDISSDELEEINITLDDVSEDDFDI